MTKAHWEAVLSGLSVRTALDVSIGTGSLTLPLAALGVSLYGSDLSETMLARCREKAVKRGLSVDLRQSDFRALTAHFDRTFDCVMSTGNSLAYVPNSEITGVLEQMDALVAPGGVLYFDLRNWDRIVRQKQRFYFYDPAFLPNGDRVNLMQVWDHLPDGSITFHLLYTFERAGKIFQRSTSKSITTPQRKSCCSISSRSSGMRTCACAPFPCSSARSIRNGRTGTVCWHGKGVMPRGISAETA